MKAGNLTIDGLAKDVMNPHAVPFTRGPLGKDVMLQLLSGLYGGWPVVNENQEVIGMVTDLGVLRTLVQGRDLQAVSAEEVMKIPPVTIEINRSAEEAFATMCRENLLRLPVVREGRYAGLIGRFELFRRLIEPESPSLHTLPICHWCNRVEDPDNASELGESTWRDMRTFFSTHDLAFEDVRLAPTYCPQCLRLVHRVMPPKDETQTERLDRHPPRKRILVVDDDPAILLLLTEMLAMWEFEVLTARHGREALDLWAKTSPDGILLDLDMPVMNGRTLLDELRWKKATTPVIVMSGGADEPTLRKLLTEGAQAYLMKPFDFRGIEQTFKKVFGSSPSRMTAGQSLSVA